jgi:glycosyltransferase involved in cell wall biosynthesis
MPLVVTWHNAVLRGGAAARLLAAAERRVARRATVTLCVSADLAARAEALGARDVRIAPVGSSRLARSGRPVSEVRADLGVGADEALVLTVGRLHAQKGLDVLVRASVDVAAAVGPVRFVLAGDGPARADLAAQVDRLGAPVILAGWRDDAGDLLAAADLVVMPSRWEGSPLAAHETLLAGRPLVATAVGGLPELLDGGAALLVPADDVDALAAAVLRLLRDPGEREALAARGAARAQGWPDSAAAAAAVLGVYRELLP